MDIDFEATAKRLANDKLVDPPPRSKPDASGSEVRGRIVVRGRLLPGGRKEVLEQIAKLENMHGLHAYVLLLPAHDSPARATPLWEQLALDQSKDLLLISNGTAWEVRGWNLDQQAIAAAMEQAAPAYKRYFGNGIVQSLAALASAANSRRPAEANGTQNSEPESTETRQLRSDPTVTPAEIPVLNKSGDNRHGLATGLGIVGCIVASGIGWAIYRRNKRAAETKSNFDNAKHSAERVYTELMLASEDIGGDAGLQLQLKAADLKRQLDAIVTEAEDHVEQMSNRVVLGKIAQIENELGTLRSTRLQKAQE